MNLFTELKRRNVFRVALFYIVAAWVVIQVAETLLPVFDVPDSAIRIIVLILALGFPLAVVFSWVFELTPEGIRREKDVEVSAVTKQQTAHKLNWATLVAAVLAIGLLIADRMVPEPAGTRTPTAASEDSAGDETVPIDEGPDPASIAVLTLAGSACPSSGKPTAFHRCVAHSERKISNATKTPMTLLAEPKRCKVFCVGAKRPRPAKALPFDDRIFAIPIRRLWEPGA